MTEGSKAYEGLAGIYDVLMSGVDYRGWVAYVQELFKRYGAKPKLLLELGCGTGNATVLFKEQGYDIIGLDNSAEMLSEAKNKDADILYILQDMRAFELYGTVDAVVSLCDAINYIPGKKGLSAVFSLVHNYLNPGGLFIFDINTTYKYKRVLGNNSFTDETPEASYIWRNAYNKSNRINEYDITFFHKQADGLYERFHETHYQRSYSIKTMAKLLEAQGLAVRGVFADSSFKEPEKETERVFFVAARE